MKDAPVNPMFDMRKKQVSRAKQYRTIWAGLA